MEPSAAKEPRFSKKNAEGRDLPYLHPGDKAVIAPVHPVVTVKKNSYADKRLRLESISLVQEPVPTWCKILPRTTLAYRFMIIERRVQTSEKYIVVIRTVSVSGYVICLLIIKISFVLFSGFSETHVFSFDRYPELYLKTKDIVRIRKQGKLEIVKDDTIRKPTYCTSANLHFLTCIRMVRCHLSTFKTISSVVIC